jgi:ribose-phosphate pyrophosphokinase
LQFSEKLCNYETYYNLSFKVSRFSDGEVKIQVNDNVRGKDVYIIQPTCPPVNENLMEVGCVTMRILYLYVYICIHR